jgi:hypothetical protein
MSALLSQSSEVLIYQAEGCHGPSSATAPILSPVEDGRERNPIWRRYVSIRQR